MILHKQVWFKCPGKLQHLPQALVNEHVLTPFARPRTRFVKVHHTYLPAVAPSVNGVSGEDFQGPMQAKPAVVQVDTLWHLLVMHQDGTEPSWEEDCIRVHLDSPIMQVGPVIGKDPLPNSKEHRGVEARSKLSSHFAVQVAVHNLCDNAIGDLDLLVAVHSILVTAKDTLSLLILKLQKSLFIAPRKHERETKQGLAGSPFYDRERPAHLAWPSRDRIRVRNCSNSTSRVATFEKAELVHQNIRPSNAVLVKDAQLATVLKVCIRHWKPQVIAWVVNTVPHATA
mmetsp:Transcript_68105/g.131512  ORF Transcript_68105/g.131512 Transcript_68105/m.131512 type:complete len:285 (-) Transcript_68105:854-1708(-)